MTERLNDLQVLVTAREAYPVFEEAVLAATERVDMGFRIFDPRTPLYSDAARALGETWVDLLLHKLNQGVKIRIKLTDFDPVVRGELHQKNWKSLRILKGIGEMADNPELMQAHVLAHPARVGWGPRTVLWPKVIGKIAESCQRLNALTPDYRKDALKSMPRLRGMVADREGELEPLQAQFPSMMPVTHHQKVAVMDDHVLYIGGLDLDQRRYDTKAHRLRPSQTWHDVQLIMRDPARAKAARRHLDRLQGECAGELEIDPPNGLLRTLSMRRPRESLFLSPSVEDTGILQRHLECISRAEKLIYLENQFLRDPVITAALVDRARKAPDLGLIVVLPAAPQEVAFEGDEGVDQKYGEHLQADCLDQLAAAFDTRLFVGAPAQKVESDSKNRDALCGAPIIFIHSKVSIFDEAHALVTSANLNGRSMRWDTELGIEVADPEQVAHLRQRVMRVWLPSDAGANDIAARPETVKRWRDIAFENKATAPRSRRSFLLPYDHAAAKAFGKALPAVPVEMV